MSIYDQLKKLNLASWSTLLVGFDSGFISRQDIEDYATSLLEEKSSFNLDIALLASIDDYDSNEMRKMIEKQLNLKYLDKEVEIKKIKLAALLSLEESSLSEEDKCYKLQKLYAEFNFPNDMSECSIYSTNSKISPLSAMHNLIVSLKKYIE